MTPYQIELMLHFHCCVEPYEHAGTPAWIEAMDFFKHEGLLQIPVNVDRPLLTDRGRAYIHFLTAMPLPVASWNVPGPVASSIASQALP